MRAIAGALAAGAAGAATGCLEIADPYPRFLPPNFVITPTPAHGALVDAAALQDVVLEFDRPMERESLTSVQRVSFLLPLAVDGFEGRWEAGDTRVTFDLDEFPIQPGTTYEARFVGLRAANGELYNNGPFDVRFRTRGTPNLFPFEPHSRVATRVLCRRDPSDGGAGDCVAVTMHLASHAPDSLRIRTAIEDVEGGRADWYRRTGGRVVWLGWDEMDLEDAVVRSVRWPAPPPLLAQPSARGTALEAAAQSAATGERLLRWRSLHVGSDSPVANVEVDSHIVEVVYTGSTTLDLDWAWRDPDGVLHEHRERWWLYPGVGVVRRDVRVQRDDGAPETHVVDLMLPSILNFVQ